MNNQPYDLDSLNLQTDNKSRVSNLPIVITTLLGEYFFKQPWFSICAETWKLANLNYPIYIINDGSLSVESQEKLIDMGFNVPSLLSINEQVNPILENLPAISNLRSRSNLFKKIVDTSIFFHDKRILYVDSDVVFRKRFSLPQDPPPILFCIDDIPGYGGSWQIPLRYTIANGLNSGFLYFDPSIVDIDYLEHLSHNYLLKSKNIWWLEQTCWAVLVGKTKEKGIFEGEDACIISGLSKRTPSEIRDNKTTYFRNSIPISDFKTIESLMGTAAVVHFAGPGKPWIRATYQKILSEYDHNKTYQLRWRSVENATWQEKLFIAVRMLIKG
jgi:hypothetical protein